MRRKPGAIIIASCRITANRDNSRLALTRLTTFQIRSCSKRASAIWRRLKREAKITSERRSRTRNLLILVFSFFLLVFDQHHIRARLLPHNRQLFA